MIDAVRAIRRTSQLRKLCQSLQETGHRLRIAQSAEGFVGSSIAEVYWTHDDPLKKSGYAEYFIQLTSGKVFHLELDRASPRTSALPGDAVPMTELSKMLRGLRITAVHEGDDADVLIMLDNGCGLHLIRTFNGEISGNNLILESPEELAQWNGHSHPYCRRIL